MKSASILASLALISSPAVAELEVEIGGSIEAIYFHSDLPSPGLLKFTSEDFFSPQLELSIDATWGNSLYLHATARYDRGFDAGDRKDGQVRLDEAFLRYTPFKSEVLNIQIGKSATVFGAFVNEHQFHDNPFLIAPLPYNQLTGAGVLSPNTVSPEAILDRANGITPGIYQTPKAPWATTIWGPVYSTGLTIHGTKDRFDYGFEIKNVDLAVHADQWNPDRAEYDHPSFAFRLGYRPDHAWKLGFSYAQGSYLNVAADRLLPAGVNRGDFLHRTLGLDARWEHHDLIIAAEIIANQYETLRAGDLENISAYLQARWKILPGTWLAGRIGHTFNNSAIGPSGESLEWSPDLWRLELGLGYRITPDLLLKTQYAYTGTEGDTPGPGRHLYALGMNYRF